LSAVLIKQGHSILDAKKKCVRRSQANCRKIMMTGIYLDLHLLIQTVPITTLVYNAHPSCKIKNLCKIQRIMHQ
jgi:hypothetical protein